MVQETNSLLNNNYIKNHLIAYIGNKRGLIPLIHEAIKEVSTNGSTPVDLKGRFIDLFSGSGVVARLAKSLGFSVIANDWEHYSYVINKAFLELNESDLQIFDDEGGIDLVLSKLNNLVQYVEENAYISKYYCPENDSSPDIEKERMFYTRQNGILIDNIRAEIESKYPHGRKRDLLLALLLHECSVRSNTNGVFKAFHAGFGGRGKDALGRILKPVRLERPSLSSSNQECFATRCDAGSLIDKLKDSEAEIVYMDPPYNQHQYGSNYHLLNTIAHGDRPSVSKDFMVDGKKIDKSAIRKDWVNTKSPYCYKQSALKEFSNMIKNVNAKYILISYSTEGIMPFDELLSVLSLKGRVGIVTTGYVRYRGGRQANTTKNKNIEYILIIDTHAICRKEDIDNVRGVVLASSVTNIMDQIFPLQFLHPDQKHIFQIATETKPQFQAHVENNEIKIVLENGISFNLNDELKINTNFYNQLEKMCFEDKATVYKNILTLFDYDNAFEIEMILNILERTDILLNRKALIERVATLYKKINFKKTPDLCQTITKKIVRFQQNSRLLTTSKTAEKKLQAAFIINRPLIGFLYFS